MRAALCLASLLCGCGSGALGGTGLEIVVRYDADEVRDLAITGEATRPFGPYVVSAAALPSGGLVSIRLDPADAGRATVCAQARDGGGRVIQSGCGTYDVRAGEIDHGTLDLAGTSAMP